MVFSLFTLRCSSYRKVRHMQYSNLEIRPVSSLGSLNDPLSLSMSSARQCSVGSTMVICPSLFFPHFIVHKPKSTECIFLITSTCSSLFFNMVWSWRIPVFTSPYGAYISIACILKDMARSWTIGKMYLFIVFTCMCCWKGWLEISLYKEKN